MIHENNTAQPFSISRMDISQGRDQGFQFIGSPVKPAPSSTRCRFHKHSHYELVYVAEGEWIQHFENGYFRYQKGDACLLNRNIQHHEGFESDCQIFFVNMQPEFLNQILTQNDIHPHTPQGTQGPIRQFVGENQGTDMGLDPEYIDFACTLGQRSDRVFTASVLLDHMVRELTERGVGYAFRIQALLLELFQELENPEHYHLSRIRVNSKSEDFIYARLLRYMEERCGRASREELGRILHYNGDYLNRIVKRQCGLTISQLGQKICLREAKRLLTETDLSITSIINRLGYVNRSHFYRLFTEETGQTPQQYRTHSAVR